MTKQISIPNLYELKTLTYKIGGPIDAYLDAHEAVTRADASLAVCKRVLAETEAALEASPHVRAAKLLLGVE